MAPNTPDFDLQVVEVAPRIFVPIGDRDAWEEQMENDPDFQQRMDALMDQQNHDGLSNERVSFGLSTLYLCDGTLH